MKKKSSKIPSERSVKKGNKLHQPDAHNVIVLSNKEDSQPKSPKKRRAKKRVKFNKNSINNIVNGLNDIINELEKDPTKDEDSKIHQLRKMSEEIAGEQVIRSPKKSPRKQRAKRKKNRSKKSIMKAPYNLVTPKNKIKTMVNLSSIVAGLDQVLGEGKQILNLIHEFKIRWFI